MAGSVNYDRIDKDLSTISKTWYLSNSSLDKAVDDLKAKIQGCTEPLSTQQVKELLKKCKQLEQPNLFYRLSGTKRVDTTSLQQEINIHAEKTKKFTGEFQERASQAEDSLKTIATLYKIELNYTDSSTRKVKQFPLKQWLKCQHSSKDPEDSILQNTKDTLIQLLEDPNLTQDIRQKRCTQFLSEIYVKTRFSWSENFSAISTKILKEAYDTAKSIDLSLNIEAQKIYDQIPSKKKETITSHLNQKSIGLSNSLILSISERCQSTGIFGKKFSPTRITDKILNEVTDKYKLDIENRSQEFLNNLEGKSDDSELNKFKALLLESPNSDEIIDLLTNNLFAIKKKSSKDISKLLSECPPYQRLSKIEELITGTNLSSTNIRNRSSQFLRNLEDKESKELNLNLSDAEKSTFATLLLQSPDADKILESLETHKDAIKQTVSAKEILTTLQESKPHERLSKIQKLTANAASLSNTLSSYKTAYSQFFTKYSKSNKYKEDAFTYLFIDLKVPLNIRTPCADEIIKTFDTKSKNQEDYYKILEVSRRLASFPHGQWLSKIASVLSPIQWPT